MRIKYETITLKTILNLVDLFPNYDIICDGDTKEIVFKEKIKEKVKN
ncbi:hypothetical protein IKD56_04795 [bacterium]|nr:hypothetical protein [bacterium]